MKISVIVPVYNVGKYLNRCIDSILAQTFTDFELLLIDDGSTDNSGKLCDEYAAKDKRVRVFHKENGGLSDARNFGIEYALTTDSEWITFIDSDDFVHKQYLYLLYNSCKNYNADVGCCTFSVVYDSAVDEEKTDKIDVKCIAPEEYWCYTQRNATMACCKLFNVKMFYDVRFPKGLINEDELTTYKALFKSNRIALVELALYKYFVNPKSITHSSWSPKNLVAFQAYKEQCEYFLEHGFLEAFKCSNRAYVFMIYFMFCEQCVVPKGYKKYKRVFLKQWKADFKRWRKTDLLKGDKKYRWPFTFFYPIKIGLIENVRDVLKQGGLKAVKEKIKEHKRKKALFKENYKDK